MLRIFDKFNQRTTCKICNTNKSGKAVLIPIGGTEDGGNVQAELVHLDCLDLQLILGDCGTTYYIVQTFNNDDSQKEI